MKISSENANLISTLNTKKNEKTAETATGEKPSKIQELREAAASISGQISKVNGKDEGANVKISDKAKVFAKAKEIAQNAPDVRSDKVSYFKDLIQKGQYNVDSAKIAEKMLEDELKNDIFNR